MTLDEMPISQAVKLYYEKHKALKEGDMIKLLEIKKSCPELFEDTKEAELCDTIFAVEVFRASPRYKELRKQDLKEQLSVISNCSDTD